MHDFIVSDLHTANLSRLVIKSAHSGGIEGSTSNIIVSIDEQICMLEQTYQIYDRDK